MAIKARMQNYSKYHDSPLGSRHLHNRTHNGFHPDFFSITMGSYAYPCGPTGVCNCQQEVADCLDVGLTPIPRFTFREFRRLRILDVRNNEGLQISENDLSITFNIPSCQLLSPHETLDLRCQIQDKRRLQKQFIDQMIALANMKHKVKMRFNRAEPNGQPFFMDVYKMCLVTIQRVQELFSKHPGQMETELVEMLNRMRHKVVKQQHSCLMEVAVAAVYVNKLLQNAEKLRSLFFKSNLKMLLTVEHSHYYTRLVQERHQAKSLRSSVEGQNANEMQCSHNQIHPHQIHYFLDSAIINLFISNFIYLFWSPCIT